MALRTRAAGHAVGRPPGRAPPEFSRGRRPLRCPRSTRGCRFDPAPERRTGSQSSHRFAGAANTLRAPQGPWCRDGADIEPARPAGLTEPAHQARTTGLDQASSRFGPRAVPSGLGVARARARVGAANMRTRFGSAAGLPAAFGRPPSARGAPISRGSRPSRCRRTHQGRRPTRFAPGSQGGREPAGRHRPAPASGRADPASGRADPASGRADRSGNCR